jgi:hypothetical protein
LSKCSSHFEWGQQPFLIAAAASVDHDSPPYCIMAVTIRLDQCSTMYVVSQQQPCWIRVAVTTLDLCSYLVGSRH